eukprot:6174812-Pleurochrysis_carterae.AAC.1
MFSLSTLPPTPWQPDGPWRAQVKDCKEALSSFTHVVVEAVKAFAALLGFHTLYLIRKQSVDARTALNEFPTFYPDEELYAPANVI